MTRGVTEVRVRCCREISDWDSREVMPRTRYFFFVLITLLGSTTPQELFCDYVQKDRKVVPEIGTSFLIRRLYCNQNQQ